MLGVIVMRQLDNFSSAFQRPDLSAAGAHNMIEKVVKTLDSMSDEKTYTLFWGKVNMGKMANELGVGKPALPRKRNKPARLSEELDCEITETTFEHYRNIYVQTIVQLTINLRERFGQPDFATYKQSEDLLLKAANGHPHTHKLESVISV